MRGESRPASPPDSPALRSMQCSSGTKSTYSTRFASSPANDEAIAGRSALLLTRPTPRGEGRGAPRCPKPSLEGVPPATENLRAPGAPLHSCQIQYLVGRSQMGRRRIRNTWDLSRKAADIFIGFRPRPRPPAPELADPSRNRTRTIPRRLPPCGGRIRSWRPWSGESGDRASSASAAPAARCLALEPTPLQTPGSRISKSGSFP